MKTQYIEKTTSNTQNSSFGYWDEEKEDWIPIRASNINETAKFLKASPELLLALSSTFEELLQNVNADLVTVWERLNLLEEKLDKG